jgi:cell division protein FtsQ
MWDNPRLLNLAAGVLVGVASLLLAIAAIQLLLRSEFFPLRELELTSAVAQTSRAEIEAAVRERLGGNFFAVELEELRSALERLPWVRRVALRRHWPDRVEVTIEEHEVLARWGDSALVNTYGERFQGKSDAPLPVFVGPAGSEGEIARRYARFAAILAPVGGKLERVTLSSRFAWQLRLANGVHIVLGRDADAAEARLKQFVAVYPTTLAGARRYEYVDLRYPNGFALRLPQLKS